MIQIDDAGSGSLVGGTCIGAIRVETGEFFYEVIPMKYYSKEHFRKKEYLDYVVEIVERLLKKLNHKKEELIEVCRGYMFDKLRKWFDKGNYTYESVKIAEPLQSVIERTFEDYTISLGLPEEYIRYTKYPFHFHTLLKWVYADYDNRVKLCKTGWKSWMKYGHLKTTVSKDYVTKSKYVCMKCGESIKDNSQVRKIQYNSNRLSTIFLHLSCGYEQIDENISILEKGAR